MAIQQELQDMAKPSNQTKSLGDNDTNRRGYRSGKQF